MGARLSKGFQAAQEAGGTQAVMRLAMKFGMTSDTAKSVPDTTESVAKMQDVLKAIIGKDVSL